MPASIQHDFILEFKKSCTKREAVARLLGWMTGPIYDNREFAESDEGILYESDLVFANYLNDTLENIFWDLLKTLQYEIDEAKSANASDDEIKKKEAAFDECVAKIYKVESYLIAIEEELCKGESSVLKIDQETTRKTGIPHIMLGSLDQWAKEKYSTIILQSTEPRHLSNQLGNTKKSSSQNKGLGATRANNLFVTFAFLVDALSQLNTEYQSAGKPIVSVIARDLEKLARNANNGQDLSGQDEEAIKDRIEEAMKVKKSELPINS